APRKGDIELEDVGKGAAMPWEADGKRWHTQDRVSYGGKPCRWDGEILTFVEGLVHEAGLFGETDWSQRTGVEIAAPTKSQCWFVHAMTGDEWMVRLVFRVGKTTFKGPDLAARLKIKPLNKVEGVQVYGNEERVWVTNHDGPWQSVTVKVLKKEE